MISKKTIQKWNEHFKSLTKAEQRVAIAKDVLKQIKTGTFEPTSGYLHVNVNSDDLNGYESAQLNLDKITCYGCAVAACVFSLVKYTNECSIDELDRYDLDEGIFKRLTKYFSLRQLLLIEGVYENYDNVEVDQDLGMAGENGYRITEADVMLFDKLEEMGDPYDYHGEECLKMIMENIVRNNGTFKPLDIPKKKKS